MRTTLTSVFRDTQEGIQLASERLAEFQRQVSSGRRMDLPSDDPTSASAAVREHAELSTIERYTKASETTSSRLTVVDSVLTNIVERLSAAQTFAMSARGTSVTATQRTTAGQQLRGIRDALFEDMNTAFSGVHLFSGTASTTPPFVRNPDGSVSAYQGNTETASIGVDRGRDVPSTFDGSALTQGSDAADVFSVFSDLITAVEGGDSEAVSEGMLGLQRAFERATSLQSRVGTDLQTLDSNVLRLGALKRGAAGRLSSLEDTNLVAAISGMTESETAYKAALAAAGKVANISLLDYLK